MKKLMILCTTPDERLEMVLSEAASANIMSKDILPKRDDSLFLRLIPARPGIITRRILNSTAG